MERVPCVKESVSNALDYAAKRIVDAEKLQTLEKRFSDFIEDSATNRLQEHLLQASRTTNIYNSLFFSGWLHLSQRSPLPFGENYSVVLTQPQHITTIEQAAAIYISRTVTFYKNLAQFKDERNGKTLDTLQYKNLFKSCRIPGIEMDTFNKYETDVDYVMVLYNCDIYCVKVLLDDRVREISSIITDIKAILCNSVSNKINISALTSLKRDEAFHLRNHVSKLSTRNQQNLELIDKSLFIVCLEPNVHLKGESPFADERNVFNYGVNRWYEKFQVIATGTGRVAFNFEHSMIDSGPVHTFIESIQGCPDEIFSSEVGTSLPLQCLAWDLDDELQAKLESWKITMPISASCDVVINCMGREYMKSKKLSPDAVAHVALHLALFKYYGTLRYFLETVDARHCNNARLQILPIFTTELRLFLEEYSKGNNDNLPHLLANACNAHKSLICDENKRHYFLHIVFLSNELHTLPGSENDIINDPIYQELFTHQVISSNLGYFKGIDFVYAGHPVDEDTMVLGFVLENDKVLITYTIPVQAEMVGVDRCFKEAFEIVYKLLDKL